MYTLEVMEFTPKLPQSTVPGHATRSPSAGGCIDTTIFVSRASVIGMSIRDVACAFNHLRASPARARLGCRAELLRQCACLPDSIRSLNLNLTIISKTECLGKSVMPITSHQKRVTFSGKYVVPLSQEGIVKQKIQILACLR